MWTAHWGLNRDPFLDRKSPYVPLGGHEEAVARLVHTIEAGQRLAILSAPAGMGKTRVLDRGLAQARSHSRRFARASGPLDGGHLFTRLAEGLGSRVGGDGTRGIAWRALERAVQVCALQSFQVVLAVDDCHALISSREAEDLRRLCHLGETMGSQVTVLLVPGDEDAEAENLLASWTLAIRLRPLSRSEVERFVTAKLAAAGGCETIFTPRALTRLHLLSGGTCRGLERLASLCLMAGASRGLEAISSELVESVAGECLGRPELALQT